MPIAFYPRPIRPIMHIRPSAYRLYTMPIRPIMHIRPSAYQPPIRPTMPIMPSRSPGPIHLPFGKKNLRQQSCLVLLAQQSAGGALTTKKTKKSLFLSLFHPLRGWGIVFPVILFPKKKPFT